MMGDGAAMPANPAALPACIHSCSVSQSSRVLSAPRSNTRFALERVSSVASQASRQVPRGSSIETVGGADGAGVVREDGPHAASATASRATLADAPRASRIFAQRTGGGRDVRADMRWIIPVELSAFHGAPRIDVRWAGAAPVKNDLGTCGGLRQTGVGVSARPGSGIDPPPPVGVWSTPESRN